MQCDCAMRLCESVPRGFTMRLCHAVPMENGSRFFMTLRKWMATYFNSPPTKPMSSEKVTSIDINDLHMRDVSSTSCRVFQRDMRDVR